MKLNVSYPATGCQKLFEVVDEHKIRIFYEKRMGQEVEADLLGDEWKGYILKIAGGNDKQGFPMKQGVLTNSRVRLLLSKGHSCYRPRRTGERKRKSVRGCIVDGNLSVLALVIVRKGDQEISGLTDTTIPRRLGPKRASRIRKLFNLSKEDDVRQYVVKRPLEPKEGKTKVRTKAPKIQRLITPVVLQRKRHRLALKKKRCLKRKEQEDSYAKLLAQRKKESKARRELIKRRRSASMRDSKSSSHSGPKKSKPIFSVTNGKATSSKSPAETTNKVQGVLTNSRVRLLLSKGHSCYRPRRTGERKRKSVRGCIVDGNLSVLALVIVRKGEQEIPGLTDTTIPRCLGPKRASRIRKLFNLSKEDDVRQYVVKRPLEPKEGKTKVRTKAPKIQRLITPVVLQRKRHRLALKKKRCLKRKEQEDSYAKLLAQRKKESKARRELIKRRRSASMRDSKSSSHSGPK
ncbi:hypothetical protein JTB14_034288 [Gonioctena quinquepunctata]|nr:hypothetical protein JTB14_034288 [Gonioctena quinquepunctata]